jgi:uncharacterized protein
VARIALDVLGSRNMLAVTGISASVPELQRQNARDFAARFGIPHLEIETHELAHPRYRANDARRCYFCKSELWSKLEGVARERGLAVLMDGSNADDARDYRPGLTATRQSGVRSPLLEVGLTKAGVRKLSRMLSLPTWDQPSSPCLSSRLSYGLAVTPERLRQVELAEAELRALGFREFRVRHHADAARLEFARLECARALARAGLVATAVRRAGFTRVLLDVEGYRTGALNEGLGLITLGRAAHLDTRLARARQLLAERGLPAALSMAGQNAEVLALLEPLEELERPRALAPELKALGFTYVTLELHGEEVS